MPVDEHALDSHSKAIDEALASDTPPEMQAVDVKDLVATQEDVGRRKLLGMVRDYQPAAVSGHRGLRNMVDDLPVVAKVGGKAYVYDGYHRITAERMLGSSTVKVRLVDLSG